MTVDGDKSVDFSALNIQLENLNTGGNVAPAANYGNAYSETVNVYCDEYLAARIYQIAKCFDWDIWITDENGCKVSAQLEREIIDFFSERGEMEITITATGKDKIDAVNALVALVNGELYSATIKIWYYTDKIGYAAIDKFVALHETDENLGIPSTVRISKLDNYSVDVSERLYDILEKVLRSDYDDSFEVVVFGYNYDYIANSFDEIVEMIGFIIGGFGVINGLPNVVSASTFMRNSGVSNYAASWIAKEAANYDASINFVADGKMVTPKDIQKLSWEYNKKITVLASGPEALQAVKYFLTYIMEGLDGNY